MARLLEVPLEVFAAGQVRRGVSPSSSSTTRARGAPRRRKERDAPALVDVVGADLALVLDAEAVQLVEPVRDGLAVPAQRQLERVVDARLVVLVVLAVARSRPRAALARRRRRRSRRSFGRLARLELLGLGRALLVRQRRAPLRVGLRVGEDGRERTWRRRAWCCGAVERRRNGRDERRDEGLLEGERAVLGVSERGKGRGGGCGRAGGGGGRRSRVRGEGFRAELELGGRLDVLLAREVRRVDRLLREGFLACRRGGRGSASRVRERQRDE